jgi:hypothetical protein
MQALFTFAVYLFAFNLSLRLRGSAVNASVEARF